jgi:GNAT superfamily N-acetyltransferase
MIRVSPTSSSKFGTRRGQGIARALMLEALARVRADGVHEIEATSWSFNDSAHTMFRRLGFVPKTVRFELTGGSS